MGMSYEAINAVNDFLKFKKKRERVSDLKFWWKRIRQRDMACKWKVS